MKLNNKTIEYLQPIQPIIIAKSCKNYNSEEMLKENSFKSKMSKLLN